MPPLGMVISMRTMLLASKISAPGDSFFVFFADGLSSAPPLRLKRSSTKAKNENPYRLSLKKRLAIY
jgi:hypothetical protein